MAARIGDQTVASTDVRYIDKRHVRTQQYVESRRPRAVAERVNAQAAVVVFVDIHGDKVSDLAAEEESSKDGLACSESEDDLVLLERELLDGGRAPNGWHGVRVCDGPGDEGRGSDQYDPLSHSFTRSQLSSYGHHETPTLSRADAAWML